MSQSPVLFRIAADLTHMQVQVDVDESDVGALKRGRLSRRFRRLEIVALLEICEQPCVRGAGGRIKE